MREEVLDRLFDDTEAIWEFLYEKLVVEAKYTKIDEHVWKDFIKTKKALYTEADMQEYYESKMMSTLHKALIDDQKILSLFKVLRLRFSPEIEQFFECRTKAKLKTHNNILYGFSMPGNGLYQQQFVSVSSKSYKPQCGIQKEEPVVESSSENNSVDINPAGAPSNINDDDDEITNEFIEKMWLHVENLIGKTQNNTFVLTSFWKKFAISEEFQPSRGFALAQYFSSHIQDIWSRNVDLELKLKFLFDLKFKMTDDIQKSLLRVYNVHIDLDEDGLIENWRSVNEETMHRIENDQHGETLDQIPTTSNGRKEELLPRQRISRPTFDVEDECDSYEDAQRVQYSSLQPPMLETPKMSADMVSKGRNTEFVGRTAFTPLDHLDMADFLYNEIFADDSSSPRVIQPKGVMIWRKFIDIKNSPKSEVNLSSHYRKWFQNILYTIPFPHDKILKLYKHLKIEVNSSLLTILETNFNAKIKLIEDFVYSWKFNDATSQKRKRGGISPNSSTDGSPSKRRKNRSSNNSRTPVKSTPRERRMSTRNRNNESREQEDEEIIANNVISESEEARFLKHYSISNEAMDAMYSQNQIEEVEKENVESEQPQASGISRFIVPKLESDTDVSLEKEATSSSDEVDKHPFKNTIEDSNFEETRAEEILKEGLKPISAGKKPRFDEELEKTLNICRSNAKNKDNYLEIVRHVKEQFQNHINFII